MINFSTYNNIAFTIYNIITITITIPIPSTMTNNITNKLLSYYINKFKDLRNVLNYAISVLALCRIVMAIYLLCPIFLE